MTTPEDLHDSDRAANRRELRRALMVTVLSLATVSVASLLLAVGIVVF